MGKNLLPCGPFPFLFVNKITDHEKLRSLIREMASRGISGFFFHARRGIDEKEIPPPPRRKMSRSFGLFLDVYYALMRFNFDTPYLKPQWGDMLKVAIEEAMKAGLVVGFYDELDWPSGTAAQRIQWTLQYAQHLIDRKGNVYRSVLYSDTMNPDVANEMIKRVYEKYMLHFPEFNKVIPIAFSDEVTAIHIYHCWQEYAPWSPQLGITPEESRIIFSPPMKEIGGSLFTGTRFQKSLRDITTQSGSGADSMAFYMAGMCFWKSQDHFK